MRPDLLSFQLQRIILHNERAPCAPATLDRCARTLKSLNSCLCASRFAHFRPEDVLFVLLPLYS